MLGSVNVDKLFDKPWINNINIITAGSTSNAINLLTAKSSISFWATIRIVRCSFSGYISILAISDLK